MWRKITANDRNQLTVLDDIKAFLLLDKKATTTPIGNFTLSGVTAQNSAVVEIITVTCVTITPATFSVIGSVSGTIAASINADEVFQHDIITFIPLDSASILANDTETIDVVTEASKWSVESSTVGTETEYVFLSSGDSGLEEIRVILSTSTHIDPLVRNHDGLKISMSTGQGIGISDVFYLPFSEITNDLYMFKTEATIQVSYETNFATDLLLGAGLFDRADIQDNIPQPYFVYGSSYEDVVIDTINNTPEDYATIFDRRYLEDQSTYSVLIGDVWVPSGPDENYGEGAMVVSSRSFLPLHTWLTGEVTVIPMMIFRTTRYTHNEGGTVSGFSEYYGTSKYLGTIAMSLHLTGGTSTGVINIVEGRAFKSFESPLNVVYWRELA